MCGVQLADAAIPADAFVADAAFIDATVGCGDGLVDPGNDEDCDDFNTTNSDGCSDICQVEPGFICVAGPSECHRTPGLGQVIITEIHKDPSGVNDLSGEWFELHNLSDETFQLLNTSFRDFNLESFSIDVPLAIAPAQSLVFGNNGNTATNGGVVVDFAYPAADFILANNGDEIIMTEGLSSVEIDRVTYLDISFPDESGRSMSLGANAYSSTSNDVGANWCDGQTPHGDGNLGTPGQLNPACP
tara:strand:+ start:74086 stop:74820 length:735 start_codon:yes stop_codon:yes gene_type:complete